MISCSLFALHSDWCFLKPGCFQKILFLDLKYSFSLVLAWEMGFVSGTQIQLKRIFKGGCGDTYPKLKICIIFSTSCRSTTFLEHRRRIWQNFWQNLPSCFFSHNKKEWVMRVSKLLQSMSKKTKNIDYRRLGIHKCTSWINSTEESKFGTT